MYIKYLALNMTYIIKWYFIFKCWQVWSSHSYPLNDLRLWRSALALSQAGLNMSVLMVGAPNATGLMKYWKIRQVNKLVPNCLLWKAPYYIVFQEIIDSHFVYLLDNHKFIHQGSNDVHLKIWKVCMISLLKRPLLVIRFSCKTRNRRVHIVMVLDK